MICSKCRNMLAKIVKAGKGEWVCLSCGSTYPLSGRDTLMYSEIKINESIPISGKTIANYASNPISDTPCDKCGAKLTRWIIDATNTRIYGCNCGNSWSSSVVVVSDNGSRDEPGDEPRSESKTERKARS